MQSGVYSELHKSEWFLFLKNCWKIKSFRVGLLFNAALIYVSVMWDKSVSCNNSSRIINNPEPKGKNTICFLGASLNYLNFYWHKWVFLIAVSGQLQRLTLPTPPSPPPGSQQPPCSFNDKLFQELNQMQRDLIWLPWLFSDTYACFMGLLMQSHHDSALI